MYFKSTIRAGLVALASLGVSSLANAADLYGERYEPGDTGEYDRPYYSGEDKRYADTERYDYNDQRDETYDEGQYAPRRSYKDGDYLPPVNRPPRFADGDWRTRQGCAPRWQIRQDMRNNGWRQIYRLRVLPGAVVFRASRPSGRTYDLKLDRCTGAVIASRPAYMGTGYERHNGHHRFSRAY